MEIYNRKAKYDYYIITTYEAGIVLKGTEVKAIRKGSVDLKNSYGYIRNGEVFLVNMFVARYEEGNRFNHEERRTRKLLLNKKEIKQIETKIEKEGWTIIPLKLYFKKGKAKILIGIAKGKKDRDKREIIKKRDLEREQSKMFKANNLNFNVQLKS